MQTKRSANERISKRQAEQTEESHIFIWKKCKIIFGGNCVSGYARATV